MVSPLFDPVVVQRKVDALTRQDIEFAQRAEALESLRQTKKYGAPREYEFAPNTSQVHVTNWVHHPWLKPLRFVYRNTPRSLRRVLKRLWI